MYKCKSSEDSNCYLKDFNSCKKQDNSESEKKFCCSTQKSSWKVIKSCNTCEENDFTVFIQLFSFCLKLLSVNKKALQTSNVNLNKILSTIFCVTLPSLSSGFRKVGTELNMGKK